MEDRNQNVHPSSMDNMGIMWGSGPPQVELLNFASNITRRKRDRAMEKEGIGIVLLSSLNFDFTYDFQL